MKRTVLYDQHFRLGARMVPFAGFEMPVEYTGVRQEHLNVREHAGVFDVSHMGEVWVRGPGAYDLVQKLTSNDISRLEPGRIQYTCFPNRNGGIVDDLLVYCFTDLEYLLVVNASNTEKDYRWVLENNDTGALVENASDRLAQLAIQGPRSADLMQKLTSVDLSGIPYYHFVTGEFAGASEVIISNSGYTGSGGFEVYLRNSDGPATWERLFEAGREYGLRPTGLAARDTLRLEMGYCLYGHDIDEETSPLEAGLGWITKFTEGNNFINRKALEEQKEKGITRRLVGFEMQERGIPRQHYPIVDLQGEPIGKVTSGTMSPSLEVGIGMGYVDVRKAEAGNDILIAIRNKQIPAKIVRLPFYRPEKK